MIGYVKRVTELSIRQFTDEISDQHYPMTGAVVAASAAQAAALGEACMQISLDNQVDKLNWQDVTARIEQVAQIKHTLVEWVDQDAVATGEYLALQAAGDDLSGIQKILCDGPAEVGQLAIQVAQMLQDFRPLVFEQVQDDLEIAISLLTGAARTAMLVLDSNLRLWPDQPSLREYELFRTELEVQFGDLSPVSRIRS
jgi:formiminotetrahydrofolate cyclodeaminase